MDLTYSIALLLGLAIAVSSLLLAVLHYRIVRAAEHALTSRLADRFGSDPSLHAVAKQFLVRQAGPSGETALYEMVVNEAHSLSPSVRRVIVQALGQGSSRDARPYLRYLLQSTLSKESPQGLDEDVSTFNHEMISQGNWTGLRLAFSGGVLGVAAVLISMTTTSENFGGSGGDVDSSVVTATELQAKILEIRDQMLEEEIDKLKETLYKEIIGIAPREMRLEDEKRLMRETEWTSYREELPTLIRLLIQIGSLHRRMREYEAAELYLARAQQLAERDRKAFEYDLGGIYRELGDLKAATGNTDEAMRFYRKQSLP